VERHATSFGNPCSGLLNISFPKLFKQWEITHLTFEVDIEPYAKERDAEIKSLAEKLGVEVITCVSHTLYNTA
jgi:cryptochrome